MDITWYALGAIVGHMLYRLVKVLRMDKELGLNRRPAETARGQAELRDSRGRLIGVVTSIQGGGRVIHYADPRAPVATLEAVPGLHPHPGEVHPVSPTGQDIKDWIVFYEEIPPRRIQVNRYDDGNYYCVFIKQYWMSTRRLKKHLQEYMPDRRIRVEKWTFRQWFRFTFLGKKDLLDRMILWDRDQINTRPMIRYADLQTRRYPALDQAIDRIAQAMAIGEYQATFSMGSSVQSSPDQKDPEIEAWEERWHRRK